jgi:hypothetical protein
MPRHVRSQGCTCTCTCTCLPVPFQRLHHLAFRQRQHPTPITTSPPHTPHPHSAIDAIHRAHAIISECVACLSPHSHSHRTRAQCLSNAQSGDAIVSTEPARSPFTLRPCQTSTPRRPAVRLAATAHEHTLPRPRSRARSVIIAVATTLSATAN